MEGLENIFLLDCLELENDFLISLQYKNILFTIDSGLITKMIFVHFI